MLLKLEPLFVIQTAVLHGHSGYEWSFYSSLEDVRDWTNCDSNLILIMLGFSLSKQWFYGYRCAL